MATLTDPNCAACCAMGVYGTTQGYSHSCLRYGIQNLTYNYPTAADLGRPIEICMGCMGITRNHSCKEKKEKKMANIVKRIKNLTVDADTKLLRKYDLEDDCGDLTSDGEEVLMAILHADNRDKLVAKAKEIQAEDKADKK